MTRYAHKLGAEKISFYTLVSTAVGMLTLISIVAAYAWNQGTKDEKMSNNFIVIGKRLDSVDSSLKVNNRQHAMVIKGLDSLKLEVKLINIKKQDRESILPSELKISNLAPIYDQQPDNYFTENLISHSYPLK